MCSKTLTALIYSALLDPSRWQVFLDKAAADLGGARLQLHGWTGINGSVVSATSGYDPAMITQYERDLRRLNPWNSRIINSPVGVVRSSQELYPEDQLKKSLFYQDWLRPQENIIAGAGVVIARTPSGPFMFGGNIRHADRESKQPQLIETLSRIAPHLAIAWRIGHSLLEPQARILAMDRQGVGSQAALILLRNDRTVAFADDAGARILNEEAVCKIDYRGRFSLRNSFAADALSVAMRGLADKRPQVVVKVPAVNGLPTLHFIGLDQEGIQDWPLATLLCLPRRSLLCVIEQPRPPQSTSHLASFNLTPAEQEVAMAIASGEGTAAIANRRCVSVTTVRSQVQAIYGKCGIDNRAALVALVLGHTAPNR